jgi:hypothetical protein
MSDMGDPGAVEAPVAEAPQEQAGPNDALMSRLDEMAQQIGKLTEAPAQPQQFQGGIADQFQSDPGFGQDPQYPSFAEDFGPQDDYQPGQYAPEYGQDPQVQQQQAMQQLQSYIAEQVQQGVQNSVTPYIQQQKANELERKYPDLATPEKAAEVVQATAQYAQRLGRPELARDPELVELVYLAQQARNSAAQETPADGDQGVHLESGGAAPQQEEMDPADRMLKAWGKL